MEPKIIIHSVKLDGPELTIDGNPIAIGFIPEEVKVEAVILHPRNIREVSTFTFSPSDFELSFKHAEQRIRDLLK
ncbi:MAG: hypothetical protein ACQEXE_10395 [Bacillota bacterium]